MLNHRTGQMNNLFVDGKHRNQVICVAGRGETVDFSVLMVDSLPNFHTISSGQAFPLYVYEERSDQRDADLFGQRNQEQDIAKDGITDEGLKHFTDAYNGESLSKEDLFYYIYGLLHSEEYKTRYADNLSKELPRIPAVKKFDDFMAFSVAGRKLADLHLNYETVEPYAVNIEGGALLLSTFTDSDYYVTQMKFASKTDKSTVIYNHKITMHNIPVEALSLIHI